MAENGRQYSPGSTLQAETPLAGSHTVRACRRSTEGEERKRCFVWLWQAGRRHEAHYTHFTCMHAARRSPLRAQPGSAAAVSMHACMQAACTRALPTRVPWVRQILLGLTCGGRVCEEAVVWTTRLIPPHHRGRKICTEVPQRATAKGERIYGYRHPHKHRRTTT